MSRQKCKFHIIGQYSYGMEMFNFCIKSDIPSMSKGQIFYRYCPMCGEKITEKIKTEQLIYNTNEETVNIRPIRRRKCRR